MVALGEKDVTEGWMLTQHSASYTVSVLKSGPVWFFDLKAKDRDCNRFPKKAGPQKPDRNRHGPVASGLDWLRPVATDQFLRSKLFNTYVLGR